MQFEPCLRAPYALQVEITSLCNLACRFCPLTLGSTGTSGMPGPMQEATWQEVLRIASRIGSVNLTG